MSIQAFLLIHANDPSVYLQHRMSGWLYNQLFRRGDHWKKKGHSPSDDLNSHWGDIAVLCIRGSLLYVVDVSEKSLVLIRSFTGTATHGWTCYHRPRSVSQFCGESSKIDKFQESGSILPRCLCSKSRLTFKLSRESTKKTSPTAKLNFARASIEVA